MYWYKEKTYNPIEKQAKDMKTIHRRGVTYGP